MWKSLWASKKNKDKKQKLFAEPKVIQKSGPSGEIYLESAYPLPQPFRCIGDWFVHWAERTPDTVFIAERGGPDNSWRKVSYAGALQQMQDIAGWLLHAGVNREKPVVILSENSVDHALLAFSAMHIGVPVATVSSAYSLMSEDHLKLKAMIELLDPGIIYVSDMSAYQNALIAISSCHNAQIVTSRRTENSSLEATLLEEARRPENKERVLQEFSRITPDTIARLLFTSGSTGTPKAVINTHEMLTSNQEANLVVWPFLADEPPVLVDWLPWSHTFGCNFSMNMVLRNGGSMYIDDGKPVPALVGKTIQNIKEIRPTIYFNVPRGYDMLVPELEKDAEFSSVFFNMNLLLYAAAALPQSTWDNLLELSNKATGQAIPLVSAWGATETAPLVTHCHFQAEKSGNIGVPIPGTTLKLVENGNKQEVRIKGPNITPGYYRLESKTREAFDEEGYYIVGDALKLADPNDASKGLFFDGRVSEDFKLLSGTWVSVGEIRLAGIDSLAPLAQDIVVTGHDSDEIGFLVFPNEPACRQAAGCGPDVPFEQILSSNEIIGRVRAGLAHLKEVGGGSSRYATRARLLVSPPDPDVGEITDKAYLNQRQILANRNHDVELLQGNDPSQYISLK